MIDTKMIHDVGNNEFLFEMDGNKAKISYNVSQKKFKDISLEHQLEDDRLGLLKIFILFAFNYMLNTEGSTIELIEGYSCHKYIIDVLREANLRVTPICLV